MRNQVQVVWVVFKTKEVAKKWALEKTLSNFSHSSLNVCVEKAAPLSEEKTAGTSGFTEPCSLNWSQITHNSQTISLCNQITY